ncbi:Rid family detoxifying hydrolase [Rubrivirga sp.]|uniref:Rid family detoxifying hydrolase n=1 Tax=Rubrivirga sp. TaxID=1885344 RepID=UPI003B519665
MDVLSAPGAPAAVGPYSHAVRTGGLLFCSGQVALKDGALVGDDVAAQTEQVFQNVRAVLSEAGLTLGDVVKTTVYLDTMDDFQAMNAVYADAFGNHRPARSTVAVAGLPVGALVEIEVIAEVA